MNDNRIDILVSNLEKLKLVLKDKDLTELDKKKAKYSIKQIEEELLELGGLDLLSEARKVLTEATGNFELSEDGLNTYAVLTYDELYENLFHSSYEGTDEEEKYFQDQVDRYGIVVEEFELNEAITKAQQALNVYLDNVDVRENAEDFSEDIKSLADEYDYLKVELKAGNYEGASVVVYDNGGVLDDYPEIKESINFILNNILGKDGLGLRRIEIKARFSSGGAIYNIVEATQAGPYDTLEEARKMMEKHRPKAVKDSFNDSSDDIYILTKNNYQAVNYEQALTYGERSGLEQTFRVNKKEFNSLVKAAKNARIENPNKWAFNRLHQERKTKTFDSFNDDLTVTISVKPKGYLTSKNTQNIAEEIYNVTIKRRSNGEITVSGKIQNIEKFLKQSLFDGGLVPGSIKLVKDSLTEDAYEHIIETYHRNGSKYRIIKAPNGKFFNVYGDYEESTQAEGPEGTGTQLQAINKKISFIKSQLRTHVSHDDASKRTHEKLIRKMMGLNEQRSKLLTEHYVQNFNKVVEKHKQTLLENIITFKLEKDIRDFFKEYLDVPVSINNIDGWDSIIAVHLPEYAKTAEEDLKFDDKISKALEKHLNKENKDDCSYIVNPEVYGYAIYKHLPDEPVTVTESKAKFKEFREAYLLNLDEEVIEEVTKAEVKSEADSNLVLDSRFIWVFAVLDKYSETVKDNIYSVDEAITEFMNNEPKATMIVAYPYIDPNPEDKNVELVFAENPGPIILFDEEKATHKKSKEDELTDDEKRRIASGEEELGKEQLEEAVDLPDWLKKKPTETTEPSEPNETAKEEPKSNPQTNFMGDYGTTFDMIKTMVRNYNNHLQNPNHKFDGEVTAAQDTRNMIQLALAHNKMEKIIEDILKMIKASENKDTKEYLATFGKWISDLVKQVKLAPNPHSTEKTTPAETLDDIAKKAGIV